MQNDNYILLNKRKISLFDNDLRSQMKKLKLPLFDGLKDMNQGK